MELLITIVCVGIGLIGGQLFYYWNKERTEWNNGVCKKDNCEWKHMFDLFNKKYRVYYTGEIGETLDSKDLNCIVLWLYHPKKK